VPPAGANPACSPWGRTPARWTGWPAPTGNWPTSTARPLASPCCGCWSDRRSGSAPHGQAPSALRIIKAMTAADPALPLLEARALSFLRQDEPVFAPLDFRLHAGELALVEGDNG